MGRVRMLDSGRIMRTGSGPGYETRPVHMWVPDVARMRLPDAGRVRMPDVARIMRAGSGPGYETRPVHMWVPDVARIMCRMWPGYGPHHAC